MVSEMKMHMEGTFKNMVTDKKTSTVGSIIVIFERMKPAESLRKKENTGLVIPEILAETYQRGGS